MKKKTWLGPWTQKDILHFEENDRGEYMLVNRLLDHYGEYRIPKWLQKTVRDEIQSAYHGGKAAARCDIRKALGI